MIFAFEVGKEAAAEVAFLACLRPPGASVVGWIDFDAEEGEERRQARIFSLLLTRSGHVIASRGDRLRAVPEFLHSYVRLRCCL